MARKKYAEQSPSNEGEEVKEVAALEAQEVVDVQHQEPKAEIVHHVEPKIERVAIVMKNFNFVIHGGPDVHHRQYKGYHAGSIIFNESTIDELLKMNAPIKVYFRHAD